MFGLVIATMADTVVAGCTMISRLNSVVAAIAVFLEEIGSELLELLYAAREEGTRRGVTNSYKTPPQSRRRQDCKRLTVGHGTEAVQDWRRRCRWSRDLDPMA